MSRVRRIAIIPARGGSKRVPDKNIRDFCGRPMISYPLEAARASGLYEMIHVSTESERIIKVVEKLGYPVDFPRSESLADDHTGVMAVMKFVLENYRERGRIFDQVTLLMATSVLIEGSDLIGACRMQEENPDLSVLGVTPYHAPPQWAFAKGPDHRLTPKDAEAFKIRSQDLEPLFHEAGSFVVFPCRRIAESTVHSRQDDFLGYVMPAIKSVDIDTPEDLEMAEALFLGLQVKNRQ